MKVITSRDNPLFKQLRSIASDIREQRRLGMTVLDGPHLVATYRERCGLPRYLLVCDAALQHPEVSRLLAVHLAHGAETEIIQLRESLFREISGTQSPVGIAAVIEIPGTGSVPMANVDCVVLDGVQDAGNVGSILRTSAAAGIPLVVLGPGCAGAWTPRVLRAAQGAHFSLTIAEQSDLSAWLSAYSGTSYAAVATGGSSLYDLRLQHPAAWVFGSEGRGIRGEILELCVNAFTIPMATTSESLNVAAAVAIGIYEGFRQRQRMQLE